VSTPIVPADFLTAANAVAFADRLATGDAPDPMITRLQVMLDRVDASPGVIDGLMGENVRKAVAAFETMRGLPADGALDADMWSTLESLTPEPVLVIHLLTPDDVAAPVYADLPTDYAELAGYDRLAYRSIVEALAERFHMDEDLLRALNPNAAFTAGEEIIVADVGSAAETDVARLVADKATAQLLGFDAAGALVVAYPATIGSDDLPSPSGVHAVSNVATDAEYWYRPAVNFQQGENTEALRLAPGPNNPIGTTWIGLDAPTYGIHGTPEPSAIDKTSSHGCVRLTNWDVEELVHLVAMGVPVEFIDGSAVAAGE
jgi:lipoprotein-anchoring transpeptidase ErfK/SrfK